MTLHGVRRKLLATCAASSLSEYDLALGSAPNWLIGELLAVLHAGGIRYKELRPGHIVLLADGSAAIARAVNCELSQPLDPIAMADDFAVPFESYEREDFRAILSGYARMAYELIDARAPGFTDTLLDHIGAPQERPRPGAPTIDGVAIFARLGIEIRATAAGVALEPLENGSAQNAWNESPVEVVTLIAACSMLEMDYSSLLQGSAAESAVGKGAAFLELLEDQRNAFPNDEGVLALGREGSVEKAALAMTLLGRSDRTNAFAYALRMLEGLPEADAIALADPVLALANRCALLAHGAGCESYKSSYYAQRAAIILQHFTRGHRLDEGRSCQLIQTLHRCGLLPAAAADGNAWPGTPTEIVMGQSVIPAYRQTFLRAAERCPLEGLSLPWSAAVRALRYARRTLWRIYEGSSREEGGMTELAALMPSVIKSYAWLLGGMFNAAKAEFATRGESGWAAFFLDGDGAPSHMMQELSWICDFLELAGSGPLLPEPTRYFMAMGERFAPRTGREGAQPAHDRLEN